MVLHKLPLFLSYLGVILHIKIVWLLRNWYALFWIINIIIFILYNIIQYDWKTSVFLLSIHVFIKKINKIKLIKEIISNLKTVIGFFSHISHFFIFKINQYVQGRILYVLDTFKQKINNDHALLYWFIYIDNNTKKTVNP